jgi:hypothetical protein
MLDAGDRVIRDLTATIGMGNGAAAARHAVEPRSDLYDLGGAALTDACA